MEVLEDDDDDCCRRLPDEILVKIFSWCSDGTLYNVMLTCRRFRNCLNINSIWKTKLHGHLQRMSAVKQLERLQSNRYAAEHGKDIYRRFSSVFNNPTNAHETSPFRCSRCSGVFCTADCLNGSDEIMVFDFGSKTTWFKYVGEMTYQLSMHPTIGPLRDGGGGTMAPATATSPLAAEICPVCIRLVLRRAAAAAASVAPMTGLDRKVPPMSCQPKHTTAAKASRFSSLKTMPCFGFAEVDGDDLVLMSRSDRVLDAPSTTTTAASAATNDDDKRDAEMYKFLLQHLLSRNAFYNFHHIPFVVCEPVGCDDVVTSELTDFILCRLKAPGVCFIPKAVATALYAGLETCLVVDSGAKNTLVTPVVDSTAVANSVQHLRIGGSHLTKQLLECLSIKGIDVEVNEMSIDSSHVKRECYLVRDFQSEARKKLAPRELPIKGSKDDKPKYIDVKLSHELYQLAEDMYLHMDLPRLILQSLETLDIPIKRRLLSNIVLTGGNCRLAGLPDRLTFDLQRLLPYELCGSVRVIDPRLMTGRSDAVIGASYIKKWHRAPWTTRENYIFNEVS